MTKRKTVSKADLVDSVAVSTSMTKKDVKVVLDAMLEKISVQLDRGHKVRLTGFGTFEVRKRKARTGVKPGSTERYSTPASTYPSFRAGKNLRAVASGPEGDPVTEYTIPKPPRKKKK